MTDIYYKRLYFDNTYVNVYKCIEFYTEIEKCINKNFNPSEQKEYETIIFQDKIKVDTIFSETILDICIKKKRNYNDVLEKMKEKDRYEDNSIIIEIQKVSIIDAYTLIYKPDKYQHLLYDDTDFLNWFHTFFNSKGKLKNLTGNKINELMFNKYNGKTSIIKNY